MNADARELYEILNSEMQPVKLVTAFVEILGRIIAADQSLKMYKKPLEKLVCFQLLQHLSTIYDAVLISKFEKMINKLETLTFLDVEYMVVQRVEDPNLRIQIDHQTGTLRFSTDIETQRIRTQLSDLYSSMQGVVPCVEESNNVAYRQQSKAQMIEQVRVLCGVNIASEALFLEIIFFNILPTPPHLRPNSLWNKSTWQRLSASPSSSAARNTMRFSELMLARSRSKPN